MVIIGCYCFGVYIYICSFWVFFQHFENLDLIQDTNVPLIEMYGILFYIGKWFRIIYQQKHVILEILFCPEHESQHE